MKRPRAAGIMARAGAVPFWGLLGAVLAILLLAGPAGAQQPPARAVRQIEALLAEKAQRTPAQRKVSTQLLEAQRTPAQPTLNSPLLDEQRTPTQQKLNSQLLDDRRTPLHKPTAAGTSRLQITDPDVNNEREGTDGEANDERVMVDIRADVTPAVLKRIRDLGGTVSSSVPKYEAIRAQLPLRAMEMLAALDAIRTIRPADEAVTRKDNTSAGDVSHRAKSARTTHRVTGAGIGIGVISDGVRTHSDRQASGDLPARVTVLPGQAGRGDEGTALLEIVHDLAPGAELYFATGIGSQAQMAANIEALCKAGANVIVDDIGYTREAAFQDDIVAKGVNAAVAGGCYFFSAGGNDGNLTDGTTGVWEGDYAAGTALIVDGETLGVRHDFGGGVEGNEVSGRGVSAIVLQWADPLGASASDYDLFLVNEDGDVIASSTDIQDGTQDPIESILSGFLSFSGLSVVVVKASGSDRYLRVHAFDGRLGIQTAGNLYGHAAAENAVSVAMVDVRTAAGSGKVFNGTESVQTDNSDGPRRIFFQPDGTAITYRQFLLDRREAAAEAGSHRCDVRVDGDARLLDVLWHFSGGAARGGDWGLDAGGGRWTGPAHPGAAPYRDDVRDRGSGHRDDRRRSRFRSRHRDGSWRRGCRRCRSGGPQWSADRGERSVRPDFRSGRRRSGHRFGGRLRRSGRRHADL